MNAIVAIGFALVSAMAPTPIPQEVREVVERTIPDKHMLATVRFLGNAGQIVEEGDLRLSIFLATLKKERDKNIGPYFQDNRATEIEMWLFQEKYDDLSWPIENFKQIIPFVTITTRTFTEPQNYFKTVQSALDGRNTPDIILIRNGWLDQMKDRLAPAPEVLFTPRECHDFFHLFACDAFIEEEDIYGAPLLIKPLVMIVNTDLLDDDRIALNSKPDRLWFGFMENGKKFLQHASEKGFFTYIPPDSKNPSITMLFSALLLQAESIGADPETATTDILELMKKLDDLSRKSPLRRPSGNPVDLFLRDEVAVIFGTQDTYTALLEQLARQANPAIRRTDIAIEPIPQVDGSNPITVAETWALAVPNKSDRIEQAWSVAAYLVEESSTKSYAQRTGKIPARKYVLHGDPFVAAAANARNFPDGSGEFAFDELISENLTEYFNGKRPLEEVRQNILNFFFPDEQKGPATEEADR